MKYVISIGRSSTGRTCNTPSEMGGLMDIEQSTMIV